jgi:hypothetical protein
MVPHKISVIANSRISTHRGWPGPGGAPAAPRLHASAAGGVARLGADVDVPADHAPERPFEPLGVELVLRRVAA